MVGGGVGGRGYSGRDVEKRNSVARKYYRVERYLRLKDVYVAQRETGG